MTCPSTCTRAQRGRPLTCATSCAGEPPHHWFNAQMTGPAPDEYNEQPQAADTLPGGAARGRGAVTHLDVAFPVGKRPLWPLRCRCSWDGNLLMIIYATVRLAWITAWLVLVSAG